MPFNIAGEWVPSQNSSQDQQKPVKVRLIKRGKNVVTVILNLNLSEKELRDLASSIKRKLGCGGAIKESEVEVQGDKVDQVKKMLTEMGIKSF